MRSSALRLLHVEETVLPRRPPLRQLRWGRHLAPGAVPRVVVAGLAVAAVGLVRVAAPHRPLPDSSRGVAC